DSSSSRSPSRPPGRQPPFSSSSSSSSSVSAPPHFLAASRASVGFETKPKSSSASGVANRLPNATGSEPEAIFTEGGGAGAGKSSMTGSTSASGTGRGGATTFAANASLAIGTTGGNPFSAAGSFPRETPARLKADFTIEISGSGGTNGFFRT